MNTRIQKKVDVALNWFGREERSYNLNLVSDHPEAQRSVARRVRVCRVALRHPDPQIRCMARKIIAVHQLNPPPKWTPRYYSPTMDRMRIAEKIRRYESRP